MKLILFFIFTFLYFTDHLITVYGLATKGIAFELNPIIRHIWSNWGIWGFVIASLLVWSLFVGVYYFIWDVVWIGFKVLFFLIILSYLATNLNHIFHFI